MNVRASVCVCVLLCVYVYVCACMRVCRPLFRVCASVGVGFVGCVISCLFVVDVAVRDLVYCLGYDYLRMS